MKQIKVELRSRITQDGDSEDFHKVSVGQLKQDGHTTRVSYLEDNAIPVQLLIKEREMILRRGNDHDNFSLMHFELGQKRACKYVVSGRQMDLTAETKFFEFSQQGAQQKVRVEYDLFSGLYLVGNYAVTLIFT
jgi:uncharacterized beta-barrel protein YwiB (DUF1934 family)